MRVLGLMLAVLLAGVVCAADAKPKKDKRAPQRVRNVAQLARLLKKRTPQQNLKGGPTVFTPPNDANFGAAADAGGGKAGGTYSGTNVQVAGVDEADFVKTDGEYSYQICENKVVTFRAAPAAEMAIVSTISFESNFWPFELFVSGNKLVVLGTGFEVREFEDGLYFPSRTFCSVRIFDTTDKAAPVEVRKLQLDGYYLSARCVGDNVYLVTRTYPLYYDFLAVAVEPSRSKSSKRRQSKQPALYVPEVSDTATGSGKLATVPLDEVWYFPDFDEPNYLIVSAFNVQDLSTPVNVVALLGAGEAVYASPENLYVAASKYIPPATENDNYEVVTQFYKYALKDATVFFTARGEVPGTIHNQFSMDEHAGHFRAATTNNRFGADQSNGVYVLNGKMETVGRLEKLAPGERIYSARFIGDRLYLVTFRQVDPLFVIGLSAPSEPVVLGELKLPGVSDYLHPYEDGYLIGIGRHGDENGFLRGLKLSFFDVRDVKAPVEKFSTVIDGSFAYTEVQYDHRALLFDRAKNLLALPVAVYAPEPTKTVPQGNALVGPWMGSYVYKVSAEEGFTLSAKITHVTDEYDYLAAIRRQLYIGDTLYTHSNRRVQAHTLSTFELIKTLELPATPYDYSIFIQGGGTTVGGDTAF